MQALVEIADFLDHPPAPEGGRLGDEIEHLQHAVAFEQQPEVLIQGDPFAHFHPVRINHAAAAGQPVCVGVGGEEPPHAEKGARLQQVIGVQITDDLPAGAAQALVDGIGLAAVGLAGIGEAPLVFFQDLQGGITGAAIDHQVLEVGIALIQDGSNGGLDKIPLVERRGDDGDFWQRSSGHF